jgi:hypothetical protein
LIQAGFRLEPFTRKGLMKLMEPEAIDIGQSLLAAKYQDFRDAPLPVALRAGAWQWLEERKPGRKRQKAVITALKGYLGQQGYYLLSALAAYPSLNWQLTLALDAQLGFDGNEARELRLRKLARLPWLRHANLPDVWRRILLNSLNPPVLEKITGAYQALIEHQTETSLELPVAIPDWKSVKPLQSDRINTAKLGDPLQDYVFACVIRGRKPSLLEFTLPHPIKGWFPPEYWRGLAAPALRFLVLMLGLSGGVYWAWSTHPIASFIGQNVILINGYNFETTKPVVINPLTSIEIGSCIIRSNKKTTNPPQGQPDKDYGRVKCTSEIVNPPPFLNEAIQNSKSIIEGFIRKDGKLIPARFVISVTALYQGSKCETYLSGGEQYEVCM